MSSEDFEPLNNLKKARQALRAAYGEPCEECQRLLPKAQPSKLLPGQRCRVHNWKDRRPRLSEEQVDAVFEQFGLFRDRSSKTHLAFDVEVVRPRPYIKT